ncbi:hypothetical protein EDD17DRAFT_1484116 [Pisolithus thermaeus]|nr:hypothetical protein EV401DRAFT_1871320 [Pisolithus croceorrhizus]KAI6160611.1 hypothetical protein EDD17DRAFT_1484116 [Pisolithus thermaeus]
MASNQPAAFDAAFEATIVDACTAHEEAHWDDDDYRRCVAIKPAYFVKFDDYETLRPEVATQVYVSGYAESDANAPRIPKILHYFEVGKEMGYAVMEYIDLTSTPAPDKAAEALRWLSEVPAPPNHVGIGPVGTGLACHGLFKDFREPLSFSSIVALERYLNKVCPCLCFHEHSQSPNTCISHERLVFTQSDVDVSNFGVDAEGKTVLLDFGAVGLLQESFVSYTMAFSPAGFAPPVANCLGLPRSPNLESMAMISGYLWTAFDPSLGASTCT